MSAGHMKLKISGFTVTDEAGNDVRYIVDEDGNAAPADDQETADEDGED